jgi:protein-export membrane protein SecD
MKSRLRDSAIALGIVLLSSGLGYFVWSTHHADSKYAIKLGLDLAGGTELIYRADTSKIAVDQQGALESLRDIIDRRVNLFGVAEPLVQLEKGSTLAGSSENRLLVELPGVTDVKAAVDSIGKTPTLDFRLAGFSAQPITVGTTTQQQIGRSYTDTGLTGQYLKSAELKFGNGAAGEAQNAPIVVLNFTPEGAALFQKITAENVGKQLAIFLDGAPISEPTIQEAISGGSATITGQFSPQEARSLVENLNFGALPVPIELVSSNTIGPTLGADAYNAGVTASLIGFALVSLFMILWYRLPGVIATIALFVYGLITIALMKWIPITLTASGIAGFILSIGLAVDANVLIFERMKEELRNGKGAQEALKIGFGRAWPAIRDGHLTMIISAIILFWIGTSLVKGFALVFGLGVLTSLFTAISVSRVFLRVLVPEEGGRTWRFLLSSGFSTGTRASDSSVTTPIS